INLLNQFPSQFGDIGRHFSCEICADPLTEDQPAVVVHAKAQSPLTERIAVEGLYSVKPPYALVHRGVLLRTARWKAEELVVHERLDAPHDCLREPSFTRAPVYPVNREAKEGSLMNFTVSPDRGPQILHDCICLRQEYEKAFLRLHRDEFLGRLKV